MMAKQILYLTSVLVIGVISSCGGDNPSDPTPTDQCIAERGSCVPGTDTIPCCPGLACNRPKASGYGNSCGSTS